MPTRIAILGWGSLIWDPKALPIKGGWQKGGPLLPIEFSRISNGSRLTLVIDPEHGVPTKTRFALSSRFALDDAIEDLRFRENTKIHYIGHLERTTVASSKGQQNTASVLDEIEEWAELNGVDAVAWTNLPSNFEQHNGRPFSVPNAIDFFRSLPESEKNAAFEYIANAPDEVDTPFRKAFREMTS